mmetsp:Transcript_70839/g.169612  ORF Transcript_70839/g.169612 Transcript_70839/m.169612 type:complete len:212 (+) Transcript_70839:26-661(+)
MLRSYHFGDMHCPQDTSIDYPSSCQLVHLVGGKSTLDEEGVLSKAQGYLALMAMEPSPPSPLTPWIPRLRRWMPQHNMSSNTRGPWHSERCQHSNSCRLHRTRCRNRHSHRSSCSRCPCSSSTAHSMSSSPGLLSCLSSLGLALSHPYWISPMRSQSSRCSSSSRASLRLAPPPHQSSSSNSSTSRAPRCVSDYHEVPRSPCSVQHRCLQP